MGTSDNAEGWSPSAIDFINKLLKVAPSKRLQLNRVKMHPWFEKFDWYALKTKSMEAPFEPLRTEKHHF